jgi:hypothetical protein
MFYSIASTTLRSKVQDIPLRKARDPESYYLAYILRSFEFQRLHVSATNVHHSPPAHDRTSKIHLYTSAKVIHQWNLHFGAHFRIWTFSSETSDIMSYWLSRRTNSLVSTVLSQNEEPEDFVTKESIQEDSKTPLQCSDQHSFLLFFFFL